MEELDNACVPYVVALIPTMPLLQDNGPPISPMDAASATEFAPPSRP